MPETPENQPTESTTEKTLELSDLPAFNEGENVKGGVYANPSPTPSPTPDPVCTTQGLSTCKINYSQVDTWCRTAECGIKPL